MYIRIVSDFNYVAGKVIWLRLDQTLILALEIDYNATKYSFEMRLSRYKLLKNIVLILRWQLLINT